MRADDHRTWMTVATAVAARSRCVRSAVGAVIVGADGRVLSTGYNGPPAGFTPAETYSSCAGFCPRHDAHDRAEDFSDCPSVHAELNALLYSDRSLRVGGTMYITRDPCWQCALAVAASGLRRVYWPAVPTDRAGRVATFLRSCGLHVGEFL